MPAEPAGWSWIQATSAGRLAGQNGQRHRVEGRSTATKALALRQLGSLAGFAPTVLRVVIGIVFTAHGLDKLQNGPENFAGFLTSLNVPAPSSIWPSEPERWPSPFSARASWRSTTRIGLGSAPAQAA